MKLPDFDNWKAEVEEEIATHLKTKPIYILSELKDGCTSYVEGKKCTLEQIPVYKFKNFLDNYLIPEDLGCFLYDLFSGEEYEVEDDMFEEKLYYYETVADVLEKKFEDKLFEMVCLINDWNTEVEYMELLDKTMDYYEEWVSDIINSYTRGKVRKIFAINK